MIREYIPPKVTEELRYVYTIPKFCLPAECAYLQKLCLQFQRQESDGYTSAAIKEETLSEVVNLRLKACLPQKFIEPRTRILWSFDGVAPQWEFCCFEKNQSTHGGYSSETNEYWFTIQIFLDNDYILGKTTVYETYKNPLFKIQPPQGLALVYHNKYQRAEEPIIAGNKYVLRTRVRYTPDMEFGLFHSA